MNSYQELLKHVLKYGVLTNNRTGVDTISVFGYQWRHNMMEGFPLLTTKEMKIRSIIYELLWFLRGEDHILYLKGNDVHIWDNWAVKNNVGPIYGTQWRKWKADSDYSDTAPIDQIHRLINNLKSDPNSRRLLVSAWNVSDLHLMCIPPCHFAFQCRVIDGVLNLHFFMRSADAFLGLPFDIASYAFLMHMLADQCGLAVGELVCSITDLHIYTNHLTQVKELLSRQPYRLPQFNSYGNRKVKSIDDYTFNDLALSIKGYRSHSAIPAPIAV